MFGIFAKTFMTASRNDTREHRDWHEGYNDRRSAELLAHTTGRRRD